MERDHETFHLKKEKAKAIYDAQSLIHCPYFGKAVVLNSDGFHHLQFSSRSMRDEKEQLLKFRLLPHALQVIRKAGTLQEYRKELIAVGKKSSRGEMSMKTAEYFGFDAILSENNTKIRTVLRKVGDGNITFWSVMPLVKKDSPRRLFTLGIEDN